MAQEDRPLLLEAETRRPASKTQTLHLRENSIASDGPANIVQTDQLQQPAPPYGSQHLVFTDPIAFRYFETDPSTTVLARGKTLPGYECYIVEQWACSRLHPTFVITIDTGDPSHSVTVDVLSISADENQWPAKLRLYFKSLNQYHARCRETRLGTMMVTNLNGFPSSLTVIPVPKGAVRDHRELFTLNENLKRLGCSGRVGFKLTDPSPATKAKFHQLYRTSDKIDLNKSVVELVKLCQDALVLFAKLDLAYADGLLCDVTEKAISDWWIEFGSEYYNVEPQDGILGPTTVSALLGMLIGARNRLSAYGAPVSKDAFDMDNMKRGISYFQRSQRMKQSRRLDRPTLERLRRATVKAASGDGWTVPRAVKSTVAELSGKGGEMVMEMVGAREKAGIAEVETTNIDRFIELVNGARPKWLWHGKGRKSHMADTSNRNVQDDNSLSVPKEEDPNGSRPSRNKDMPYEDALAKKKEKSKYKEERDSLDLQRVGGEFREKEYSSRRDMLKRAAGKMGDARSGLGRIKDVVGLRTHQSKHSKDDYGDNPATRFKLEPSLVDELSPPVAVPINPEKAKDGIAEHDAAFTPLSNNSNLNVVPKTSYAKVLTETPTESRNMLAHTNVGSNYGEEQPEISHVLSKSEPEDSSRPPTADTSIAGSVYQGVDLDELLPVEEVPSQGVGRLLRRTLSVSDLISKRDENVWPRHLSFSLAEETVLRWEPPTYRSIKEKPSTDINPKRGLKEELVFAEDAKRLQERIDVLKGALAQWTDEQIRGVQKLDEKTGRELEELEQLQSDRIQDLEAIRTDSEQRLTFEKGLLHEALKDVEMLGARLDYEINALRGKVEDVEDGVTEFERQVLEVEARVIELEETMKEKEGWIHWSWRMLTGLGSPPAS